MKIRFNNEKDELGCGLILMPIIIIALIIGLINAPSELNGIFILMIIVCVVFILIAKNRMS